MSSPSSSAAVICRNVQKTFGSGTLSVKVLHGVDLEVNSGELLMLVGPSGSGKTTLISIITGILSYEQGECIIFNNNLSTLSDKELTQFRGEHLGYVFQAFNLIPMLTAAENTAIPLLINNADRDESVQKARERLAQFGLEDHVDRYPSELSGGQQQRVAIARAVIHNPKLVVCDEPTSALDQENGALVLSHLRHIVDQENCALIVVTHDSRIFEFADRIVRIEDGKITDHQTPNKPS
ncbi:MAG: ABC transporter ATP-binding protein [Chlamydiota bacterium]